MKPAVEARAALRAPCAHACPLDQNAKEYVALIAEGRFKESLEVIRRTNPFPSVCGRICTHPCELECVRSVSGGAVAVRWLKRFVADLAAEEGGLVDHGPFGPPGAVRVAVVGGGPAGLTAALDLASLGYGVDVIEAREEPGGLMRWGIPDFRLPDRLVRLETRAIEESGVQIRTGLKLGRDLDLDGLLEEGCGAVLLAAGAGRQARLGIAGESVDGVADTLAFMETGMVAGTPVARRRVIVVGATREGIDAARLAARQGASSVALVTHLEHGPADGSEALEKDGVRVMAGLRPVQVRASGGRLAALVAERVSGRGREVSIKGSVLLPATDRHVDPGLLGGCAGVELGPFGILADPITCETSRKNVFAAGDAVTGPRTVIEAIAAGHRAAAAIHRKLSGEEWRPAGRPLPGGPGPDAWEITSPSHAALRRARVLSGPGAAMQEARRCLRCGQCLDCETCHPDCPTTVAMLPRPGSQGPSWDDPLVKMDTEVAGRVLAAARVALEGDDGQREPVVVVPRITSEKCLGCGRCADACPYDVIQIVFGADGAGVARIHEHACRACGSCAGACPVDAIDQPYWDHDSLDRAVERPGREVVAACRWSGDTAGGALPLPCAGRAGERLLVHATAAGASSVSVRDCGTSCRYRTGRSSSLAAAARVETLMRRMGLDGGAARGDVVPPLGVPTTFKGDPAPFARPLHDVDRLLARPEVVPARRGLVGQGLEVADRGEVVLYTGCLPFVDALVAGETGGPLIDGLAAAVRLLNRASIVPAVLDDERTCGIELKRAGDEESFRRLAALNAEAFDRAGARTVVTTCSEAVGALRAQAQVLGLEPSWSVSHIAVFLDGTLASLPSLGSVGPVALLDDPADREVRAAGARLVRAAGGTIARWKPPRSPARRPHGAASRQAAVGILERARQSGASLVACTSLRRSLGARYVLRSGSWDAFGVRVVDLVGLLDGAMV